MNILVTAATEAEIALLLKHIAATSKQVKPLVFEKKALVTFAITGVGMAATAYNLTRLLAAGKYDLVIQAGVAGSFDRSITLGEVLFVRSDRFADMGAEDGTEFIDVFDLGLVDGNKAPFDNGKLNNQARAANYNMKLREVDALTVNTVTGSEESTTKLDHQYNATLESMEGAAFHYVCMQEKQAFAQIRAVSNYIERRNRAAWQMEKAIDNLNKFLCDYIDNLE